MQLSKGLNTDVRPLEQPEGTFPHGKNGILFDIKGTVINEPGFSKKATVTPYDINGIIETDSKPLLFSTNDTYSAIGYFNPETDAYEPIVDDATLPYKLGFKRDNWITGQAQRNYKGQIVCAFTDKVTFPKYMNADALDVTRLEDWNLFPFFTAPDISTRIETGGRLALGTYYVAARLQRADGTITPYTPISSGKTVSGDGSVSLTDKALTITAINPDPSYDFIIFSVISKINGVVSAKELDPIPLNVGGETSLTYTGDNLSQDISLEEILVPPAIYNKIGIIGQLNDALYIAELEAQPEITDMQPYASLIDIQWKSDLIDALNPLDEHISGEKKGLMHEEVYALYVRYRLTQGGFTKWFICVNADMDAALKLPSTEALSGGFTSDVPKLFQIEDTVGNEDTGTMTGDCGKWENETETYPNTADYDASGIGGEDLRGKKVRHFKMPSIRWCKENMYPTEDSYGITSLDILGIKASNVTIPNKYIGVIDGYELGYAKRTLGNMTIYGQGVLMHGTTSRTDAAKEADGKTRIYSTGGNWRAEVLETGGDEFTQHELTRLRLNTFRFHAFDVLFNRPGIKPSYMSSQLKLKKSNVKPGTFQDFLSDVYFEDAPDDAERPIGILVDYTDTENVSIPAFTTSGNKIKKIKSSRYINNGINLDGFINIRHETALAGYLLGADWALSSDDANVRIKGSSDVTEPEIGCPRFEETYLVNIGSIKGDLYLNFYSQPIISLGKAQALTSSTVLWGGDVFVCPYTFHTYGRHEATDTYKAGKLVIRRIVCESVSNIHLRYEVPGNIYSKWYPNNPVDFNPEPNNGYMIPFDRSKDPNQFGYTRDLNALNDLVSTSTYSPFQENLNQFLYRIHRGGKLSRQSKTRSWRSFLPLDYYECQKNMGRIINVDGFEDKLIIHHENALFMTQDKAKLDTDLLGITLGSGDIFQFEPQEKQASKLGYAGTQHDLACAKTPAGYVFTDSKQGEIYLLSGGQLKNLNVGMNRFLRKYLRDIGKNPFNGNGITIGWDQYYKRILVSVKNGETSFTLSYSVEGGTWAFFHDYIPDFYFHTREQLWTLKDGRLYSANTGDVGSYYEEVPNSFFVDVVVNADADMLLEAVSWITEIMESSSDLSEIDNEWNTFTHVSVWNSQQHSGRVVLKQAFEDLQYETSRKTKGQWSFNDFRNILVNRGEKFLANIFNDYALDNSKTGVKAWYEKELMEDKYFVIRFEFDNLSKKQIILHTINAQVTKTDR